MYIWNINEQKVLIAIVLHVKGIVSLYFLYTLKSFPFKIFISSRATLYRI
jgi:hypothetical protein